MPFTQIIVCILLLLLPLYGYSRTTTPVMAKHDMVVSEQEIASQVGIDILRSGGNAIDAAVAVGYALAVVNPCCGNLGGGGFMLIHLANQQNIFLNFREKAPLAATKDMYLDAGHTVIKEATTKGYLAVAVPGTVLGLDTALQKYGTFSRQQVMAPAIQLARYGYLVTAFDAKAFQQYASLFRKQSNVATIFLHQGKPYQTGERLIQHDLANTLQHIAEKGPTVFYKGYIAKEIVEASHAHGGILTLADFAHYTVEELSPLHCDYQGYHIISAPPPSSGGTTLCEMLMILNHFPLKQLGYHSARSIQDMVEAMRYSFRDRNTWLGDPDFINNPLEQLLAKDYTTKISQQIQAMRHAPLSSPIKSTHELTDTTHYSIVDSQGNAVSVTYTLNGFFGAGVIADHTGFFLNNSMDDFTAKPGTANKFGLVQYDANNIQPGKRPLSSMTPTIISKNNQLFMVLGSPGGPRIITSVLLTILNVIDYGMNLQQAINAPRFHYQGEPDVIEMEPFTLNFITEKKLMLMGYRLGLQNGWGAVEAILIDPSTHTLTGVNDIRRPDGAAIGD